MLKLLEENMENTFQDISIGNNFWNSILIVEEITSIINKVKAKSRCTAKETITGSL